jgi:hypothetical protein
MEAASNLVEPQIADNAAIEAELQPGEGLGEAETDIQTETRTGDGEESTGSEVSEEDAGNQ